MHKSEELISFVQQAMESGLRVEVHAIGDAAAKQVLDAFTLAKTHFSRPDSLYRPVLTHCQVLGEDLLEQMKELDVIANIQPSFVPTDMRWITGRLTDSQQRYAYAWKSLLHAGIHVAGGSDAPVESASPFTGLYDAMHRSNAHRLGAGEVLMEYRPEEKLSFDEALWIYTIGGAYAAGYEDKLGRVAAGYVADLVIVDVQCLTQLEMLHELQPALVMVGGQVTSYAAGGAARIVKGHGPGLVGVVQSKAEVRLEGAQLPGRTGAVPHQNQQQGSRRGICRCSLHSNYCFT